MTRVIIMGAGIGRLTAGIALGRAGVAVTIHEQTHSLREVGAYGPVSAPL